MTYKELIQAIAEKAETAIVSEKEMVAISKTMEEMK